MKRKIIGVYVNDTSRHYYWYVLFMQDGKLGRMWVSDSVGDALAAYKVGMKQPIDGEACSWLRCNGGMGSANYAFAL